MSMKGVSVSSLCMMRWVASVVLGLMASGCAIPIYENTQPPTGTTIAFVNDADRPAMLQFYLGENCTGRRLISNPTSGLSDLSSGERRSFVFEPGKAFTFEAGYHLKTTWMAAGYEVKFCRMIYSFVPERPAYALRLSLDASSCGAAVFVDDGGTATPLMASDVLIPREHQVAVMNDGPWCMPRSE
jgi:hypothetical protein